MRTHLMTLVVVAACSCGGGQPNADGGATGGGATGGGAGGGGGAQVDAGEDTCSVRDAIVGRPCSSELRNHCAFGLSDAGTPLPVCVGDGNGNDESSCSNSYNCEPSLSCVRQMGMSYAVIVYGDDGTGTCMKVCEAVDGGFGQVCPTLPTFPLRVCRPLSGALGVCDRP